MNLPRARFSLTFSNYVRSYLPRPRGSFQCRPQVIFRPYATKPATERSSRTRSTIIGITLVLCGTLGYFYVTDTRASVHRWLVPVVRSIWADPELAHSNGVRILRDLSRLGINPRERGRPDDAGDLEIEVFGHKLVNPLGISAGLDKQGELPTQLLELGVAVVEVGGITPMPQEGNPKPRVFRVPSQKGLINRYGLNSDGAELVAARLRQRVREYAYRMGYGLDEDAERFVLDGEAGVPPGSLVKGKLMAVQVAKNEFTPDGDIEAITQDYVSGTSLLARYADIIVVNVSCPNAPGYRELQKIEPLIKILSGVVDAAKATDRKTKPFTMIKVSPDEDSDTQIASICAAAWATDIDGVIVGNTSTRRHRPLSSETQLSRSEAATMLESGGYSGPQLFDRTLALVKKYREALDYPIHRQREQQQAFEKSGDKVGGSTKRDALNLKSASEESGKQPLIRLPERHSSFTNNSPESGDASPSPASNHPDQSSAPDFATWPNAQIPKVIFCTGGITNGQQALQVLEAGASVVQIYTALVYGGVGKITSMKQEMRREIRKALESEVLGS